jgi:hypothetical protein
MLSSIVKSRPTINVVKLAERGDRTSYQKLSCKVSPFSTKVNFFVIGHKWH